MAAYSIPGYRLSMLEIQKLAYFLQVVGEPLKLRFVAHHYGPYADNLNHVLQALDGHYIRGYGDRSKDAQIYLLPNATDEAKNLLKDDTESLKRLAEVTNVIEGFETPYGMELLATTHWIAAHNPEFDTLQIIDAFQAWNERKARLFKSDHIEIAWNHLTEIGLMD